MQPEGLLRTADLKVIYTRRRNLLKTVVSNMISHQTGIWHREKTKSLEAHYAGLSPLSIYEVRERLEVLSESLEWCDAIVRERPCLAHGLKAAGAYALRWDGHDDTGRALASGVYAYRLRTPGGLAQTRNQTRKLVLVR
jgi:hypothetical protein